MSEPLTTHRPAASTPKPRRTNATGVVRAVLRGTARGLLSEHGAFQAAELWLLDESTQNLCLAVRWAETNSALEAEPVVKRRALLDTPADVAAMAGGAVVIEQPEEAIGWELPAPEPQAAICVPVSSDTTVHGVLWLLADSPRKVSDETVEMAEIVAGRLALEVERSPEWELPPTESVEAPTAEESTEPADLPAGPLFAPHIASVAPVEAAAWFALHADGLAASGCWELADGRLLAVAAAAIDAPDSRQVTQRAAIEWLFSELPLAGMEARDAGQLLTRLNRRLIESPLAGEGLAMAAALAEAPEDAEAGLGGVGTYAMAGPTAALSIRAAATDSQAGDLVPLGWSEPEAAYEATPFELPVRGRLVLVAGDPRLTSPLVERRLGDAYRAATADAHREMTAEGCLRRLAGSGADEALAAIALRRV